MKIVVLFSFIMILVAVAMPNGVRAEEFVPVCERSPAVKRYLEIETGLGCSQIDQRAIAMLENISIEATDFSLTLKCGDFSGLSRLHTLMLVGVSSDLPSCVFGELSSLRTLAIENGLVTSLPEDIFSTLGRLWYLSLKDNKISSLRRSHFRSLKNLVVLNLKMNRLAHLPEDLFADLRKLVDLNLFDNPFALVPARLFYPLLYVVRIDLRSAMLQSIPDFAFVNQTRMGALIVDGAPLRSTGKAAFHGLGLGVVSGLPDDFDADSAGEEWRRE